jgi:hypothetical protein
LENKFGGYNLIAYLCLNQNTNTMAGHLSIPTTQQHRDMLNKFPNIKEMGFFKRQEVDNGYIFRLSSDYAMDEEHGMVDDEIVSFTPLTMECIYEIHLDKDQKINQVYLVM